MRSGSSAPCATNGTSARTKAKAKRFMCAPLLRAAHIWEPRPDKGSLGGGSGCSLVAHHANLVAVRIAHVSAVIIRMIVLAYPRRPLVSRAGRKRCRMESVDRRARRSIEGHRHAIAGCRVLLVVRAHHPERLVDAGIIFRRIARGDLEGAPALQAKRGERGIVEAHRARELRGADGDVAIHDQISRPSFRSSEYSPPPRIRKNTPT